MNYHFLLGSLNSMKLNMRVLTDNTRSSKQDTKEIKTTVTRIENHMVNYNNGMLKLTNFMKVFFLI